MEEKTAVYGLENAYGYDRVPTVWLLEKGCVVNGVKTSFFNKEWRITLIEEPVTR